LEEPVFRKAFIRTAVAVSAVLALTACGGDDPLGGGDAGGGSAPDKVDSLTVGSANFPRAGCWPRSTPKRWRPRTSR
jgi:osmoprotectant transport system substrate-binding protein